MKQYPGPYWFAGWNGGGVTLTYSGTLSPKRIKRLVDKLNLKELKRRKRKKK